MLMSFSWHVREEDNVRAELEWWIPVLEFAEIDHQVNVCWKPVARIHPHIFEIKNLVAIRLIGCGIKGAVHEL